MIERLPDDIKQELIYDADRTINNLMSLRQEYFEELWDTYLHDIENAVELIDLFRGVLYGTVV